MSNQIEFSNFPSTRYQGSKRKIIPWIFDVIRDLKFNTVLDGFGGTASVSYLFKKLNKEVTFNDFLKFNYLIGKAIIENNNTILTKKDASSLLSNNKHFSKNEFIQKNFRNIYFLNSENIWLDDIISSICNLNSYSSEVLEYKRAIAYYSLFQSCLIKRPFNLFHRKNLYLRTNHVNRSFGNKTSWEKEFEFYFLKFISEANSLIFNNTKKCKSTNKSIFDMDENGYDLVYFDPPYLRKNSSNETSRYLQIYHFLEGLANYSNWGELIDWSKNNLSFKNDLYTDRFKIESVYETYEELIYKFRKSKIILSYKYGGVPSIKFLVSLLKKHKLKVYTVSKHYKYALNKQNGESKLNREVLVIGI